MAWFVHALNKAPTLVPCQVEELCMCHSPLQTHLCVTYFVKNNRMSSRYRPERLLIRPNTAINQTSPLSLTEEEERMARETLIPLSLEVDQDLFSPGDIWHLKGRWKIWVILTLSELYETHTQKNALKGYF